MSTIDLSTLYLHHAVNTHGRTTHTSRRDRSAVNSLSPMWSLTVHLIDLGVLRQNLVRELLGGGQHLGVVDRDQVLDKLLQLVSAHLKQGL